MQELDLDLHNGLDFYSVAKWIYGKMDLSAFRFTYHNGRKEWYMLQPDGRWRKGKGSKSPLLMDEVIHNSVDSALKQIEEQVESFPHGHDGAAESSESKIIKKAVRKIRSAAFHSEVRRMIKNLYCRDVGSADDDDDTVFCLDADLDLLAFSNGVYDFIHKKFRAIRPSDCISSENGLERTFPTEATEEAQKDFIQTFRPEFATVIAVRPNTPEYVCVTVLCPRCKSENSHGAPKGARRESRVCDGCPYEYYIKLE